MKNQAQLIAYVDRLTAGTFRDLQALLAGPLRGVFGGVHVLPFFHPIDGADAGFDPIDHTQVDPRLGTWHDVAALAATADVMADAIVNHISSHSPQFTDYDQLGDNSQYAGMFLTYSRVFPNGAQESDLLAVYRPRPGLPFTKHQTRHGAPVLLWTTFTSEQIDIDVHHPEGRRYLADVLDRFQAAGIRAVRLDAVGYAVKKAGTSCFMISETFDFIAEIAAEAHARAIEVLVEIHGHYRQQIEVASRVDWVYDFALPPLVLHTLYRRDVSPLKHWLDIRPHNAVTVLDTHDGIGVIDVGADQQGRQAGLLSPEDIDALVETIHERSRGESRQATGGAANNLDLYQVNCTFYDALGQRDAEHLIARAIQCFVPGIPQIYYVGLLGGDNDMKLLARTRVGRDINRHNYSPAELQEALTQSVVRSLLALLRLRNTHAAFHGTFQVSTPAADVMEMTWRNGTEFARLDVNLTEMHAVVTCSREGACPEGAMEWQSPLEAKV
jgi:sucrose phosphorylase